MALGAVHFWIFGMSSRLSSTQSAPCVIDWQDYCRMDERSGPRGKVVCCGDVQSRSGQCSTDPTALIHLSSSTYQVAMYLLVYRGR